MLERGPPPRDGGSPTTQVADQARRYAGRAARFWAEARHAAKPSPAKPTSIIVQVEGSGAAKGMKSSPCGAPEPAQKRRRRDGLSRCRRRWCCAASFPRLGLSFGAFPRASVQPKGKDEGDPIISRPVERSALLRSVPRRRREGRHPLQRLPSRRSSAKSHETSASRWQLVSGSALDASLVMAELVPRLSGS